MEGSQGRRVSSFAEKLSHGVGRRALFGVESKGVFLSDERQESARSIMRLQWRPKEHCPNYPSPTPTFPKVGAGINPTPLECGRAEQAQRGLKLRMRGHYIIIFRRMRKQSIPNFILKTWEMLQEQANWTAVAWNDSGAAFEIVNESLFTSELLPRYFRHSNLASFIRQLNMYNFHKRRTASEGTEFFHPLFRRNHRSLLIGIKRKPSQAEMAAAEQLIRQLAPECLQEVSAEVEKQPLHAEQTNENHSLGECQVAYYPDMSHMWFLTPFVGNAFPEYEWRGKVTTNIIIQSLDMGNGGNMTWQCSY